MAANDILVRLLMDSNGYNRDLSKSERKTKDFEKNIRSNITKAAGAFAKFAGAIGVGTTAFEMLDKAMHSNQQLGDKARETYQSLQKVTDHFFTSLTTGDFTPFLSGMQSMIDKAVAATRALDQLGNTRMSYNYFAGREQEAVSEYVTLASSGSADKAALDAARERAQEGLKKMDEMVNVLAADTQDAMRKIVASTAGIDASFISLSGIEDAFSIDVSANRGARKAELEKMWDQFQRESNQLANRFTVTTNQGSMFGATQTQFFDDVAYGQALSQIIPKYAKAIIYKATLNKMNDEELQSLMDLGTAYYSAKQGLERLEKQYNRAGKSMSSASVGTSAAKASPIVEAFQQGSLGYIEQQMSELKKQYEKAADDGTRIGIQKAITDLEAQRNRIETYTGIVAGGVSIPKTIPGSELNLKLGDISPKAADIQANTDYAESIAAIGSAMGGLASVTGEGAAAWLQWGSSVASSIAKVLPQIQTLIAARTAEGAVAAGASAASTPLVGWLLAGGAIASFLAAAASIPKFAEGGVVGGSSFIGDKQLAFLNSGEMVLNGSQQSKLFDKLNSGREYEYDREIRFRVHGEDLVGALRNYEDIHRRIR